MRLFAVASVVLVLGGAIGAHAHDADQACATRLLVLSAFPGEIDRILTQAALGETVDADGFVFYGGTLHGNDVVMGLTGIGLVNAEAATRAALDRFGCEIGGVVFSGVSPAEW